MASEMAPVLHKLKLDHFIDKFSSEKITPDLVGKLSLSEFRELGVQNRNEVMKLQMECSKYGPNKPCSFSLGIDCSMDLTFNVR